jgi:hypothetical protein
LAVTKTPQVLTIEIVHQFITYIANLISAQKYRVVHSSSRTVLRLKRDSRPYLCGGRCVFSGGSGPTASTGFDLATLLLGWVTMAALTT